MASKIVEALKLKVTQLEASKLSRLKESHTALAATTKDKYMASGLIIQISDLGGKSIVEPTVILDGLSTELINALRADIKESQKHLIAWHEIKEDL